METFSSLLNWWNSIDGGGKLIIAFFIGTPLLIAWIEWDDNNWIKTRLKDRFNGGWGCPVCLDEYNYGTELCKDCNEKNMFFKDMNKSEAFIKHHVKNKDTE